MIVLGDPMFYYGINPDKPVLPQGFQYIEGHGEWLQVEAPSGRRYFIARWRDSQRYVLWRRIARAHKCPCCNAVKLRYVVDDTEEIQLPQKQLTYPTGRL